MTIYLFKVVCCSGLLLLAYWLFLEREKTLRFNRLYLLFAIAFSLGIPLVTVQTVPTTSVDEVMVSTSPHLTIQPALLNSPVRSENIWPNLLMLIYAIITAVMGFRFVRNLLALLNSTRENEKTNFEEAKVVLLNRVTAPHSFFKYIFVSREDFRSGGIAEQILRHELAHVRQKHSVDIMCLEIILIFAWINPILFLYRKAIQLNHEFLADEAATSDHDIKEYQLLLVREQHSSENHQLSSSFNYSYTKKRLIMMSKQTSMSIALAKEITVLPLLIFCALVFGERAVAQQVKKPTRQAQEDAQKAQKASQQAEKDAQQARKDTQQAQKDTEQAQKEIQRPGKENPTPHVSVRNTTDPKATTEPIVQTRTLKQDDSSLQLESPRPLLDLEKSRIKNAFGKSTTAPLPKFPPTQAQLDSYLDTTVYGVWINGKRVYNWELKGCKAEDFSDVHVSAITKNTADYGKYLFHVELKKKDGC